jgi:hypothetical protein
MKIHSAFLVHWTGKDFKTTDANIRLHYLERLKDYYSSGLFMKMGNEIIMGSNGKAIDSYISRICFSEIRLSQAQNHADLYGKLGIGFHRDFVIERMGGPVFYIQNGVKGVIIEHFDILHGFLANNHHKDMLSRLQVIMGYLKNMSDPGKIDLNYYEEMEWRVVHLQCLEGKYIDPIDIKMGTFRLKFNPDDVKLIVFPDLETKKMALNDSFLTECFNRFLPMMTTISECINL